LTLSHWGAYRTEVRDGRLVAVEPIAGDPSPSPIGRSMPGTLDDAARISQPMVRQGFLAEGPASRGRRGGEPFIPVTWAEAT
ncbi:hypothetical protein, partial [Stenotrophomonas maltophilia]|uniref:hypothetical protein n=1 Tax=Stenotrophomonas maltophilia TaxID=40324 RepID=UPI001953118E